MAGLSKKSRWKAVLESNKDAKFYTWRCNGEHHATVILNGCVQSANCPEGHIYRKQEEVSLEKGLSYDYDIIFKGPK